MNIKGQCFQFYSKYQKLNFIDKPSHLICGICNEILKFSQQTLCGCRFCHLCLDKYLVNGSKICPGNLEDCVNISMNDLSFDAAVNKELMKLKVHCPHESCKVIKTLKEIIDHVDECECRMVKCSTCNSDCQFKNIKKHEDKECPNRLVQCRYCFKTITYQNYTSEHLNSDFDDLCEKYSVNECPNKCSTKGFIGNLREHLNVCSKAKQKCPLSASDCSNCKFNDEELKEHFDKNYLQHNSFLMKNISELKSKNKELETKNKELESQNLKYITLESKISSLEIKISELQTSKLNISQFESEFEKLNGTGNNSSIQQSGNFIWKVSNLDGKRHNAMSGGSVSFTSDPFYTSEFGYKMCLKIYPAGDGIGNGTHLSVFFAIMKGEFDNILSWPFKQKVMLGLLDQDGCGKHHIETFKPDEKSVCYKKPEGNMNVASGAPKFFEWKSLIESKFYKNDTIFIKISI